MGTVTLLTDFGSFYPSVMKAVIHSIAPSANVIDIAHDISPQNIVEGAFILQETVKYFPRGTVHIAVVDPTVGTQRHGLVIEAKGQYLVGPDNGLLIPAAKRLGDFEVMSIAITAPSRTFHGRDIYAPVGANLAIGILEPLTKTSRYVDLTIEEPVVNGDAVYGKVLYVDRYGNCVTNISKSLATSKMCFGTDYTLNNTTTLRFAGTYDEVPREELLLTIGSFDLIELSMNSGNAATALNLKSGDDVKISF